MIKYIIIGAGPAGLTFANSLLEKGIKSFIVLEKESSAGGLCRSELVDGFPLDIGGGHFLDVRRPKVNEFLFRFMPENEWNLFTRDSRISLPFGEINHPFEANIWQFPQSKQIEYLKSIAIAPCNLGMKIPETFIEWIEWKLGRKISEDYMIPYNKKIFGENLNQLGTYWLEKLPNVSFDETLGSCLNRKPYGTQPGHAKFLYPKNSGYGELWLRMADNLGEKIKYNSIVNPNLYIGGFLYIIAAFLNIYILKILDYSVVLPLTSFTYIWTMLIAKFFLHETINKNKIIGIICIIFGAFILIIT